MTNLSKEIAVLVTSCDRYSDLWKPFFELFRRFWPDCLFDVYLLSNHIEFADARVRSLKVGDDVSWSDNLAKAVNRLPHEYIFLFIDDLFLVGPVDHDRVLRVLDWAVNAKVNYIRLNPSQKPDRPYDDLVGIVSPGTIYRTSTVISVWKKQVLQTLLRLHESAWDFEIKGSVRSDEYDGFYSTWKDSIPAINGVIKGKWRGAAIKKLNSLGVEIDTVARSIMTQTEEVVFFCKQQRSRLLNALPPQQRRSVRALVAKDQF